MYTCECVHVWRKRASVSCALYEPRRQLARPGEPCGSGRSHSSTSSSPRCVYLLCSCVSCMLGVAEAEALLALRLALARRSELRRSEEEARHESSSDFTSTQRVSLLLDLRTASSRVFAARSSSTELVPVAVQDSKSDGNSARISLPNGEQIHDMYASRFPHARVLVYVCVGNSSWLVRTPSRRRSKLYEKRCVKDEQRKAHRFMRDGPRTARDPMQSSHSRQPLDPEFVMAQKLTGTPDAYYDTDCGSKKVRVCVALEQVLALVQCHRLQFADLAFIPLAPTCSPCREVLKTRRTRV